MRVINPEDCLKIIPQHYQQALYFRSINCGVYGSLRRRFFYNRYWYTFSETIDKNNL